MKLPEKKKVKNPKLKKKSTIKPKKEKVLVVAQEFKFARLLSGNEKKTRDRVLKSLKKWLLNCFEKGYKFKEDDFIRVWKGLFYAVWMSDKPLVQEELCDNISEILDIFPVEKIHHAIMMIKAGFRILATEWYGLDQHRMDKFLMLVRRYLRGAFRCLKRADWSIEACDKFVEMLTGTDGVFAVKIPSFARNSLSLMLHIIDCYLEELSKVSLGSLPPNSMAGLMRPFTLHVRSDTALSVAARRLLTQLIRQSELGLDYESKTEAWKKMGCPAGGPDALELVEDGDDEEEDAGDEEEDMEDDGSLPLDPRAGRVSVLLRPLPVPGQLLAEQLGAPGESHRAARRAQLCAQRFLALSCREYPLSVPASDIPERLPKGVSPGRAARTLSRMEKTLRATKDELALKSLSKRHRKRLLAKSRAGLSIVEDVLPDSTNGEWRVEEAENRADANKENIKKKKDRKRKTKNEEDLDNSKKQKISENGVNTDRNMKADSRDKRNKKDKKRNKENTVIDNKLTNEVNKNKHKQNERELVDKLDANNERKINVQKSEPEIENKEAVQEVNREGTNGVQEKKLNRNKSKVKKIEMKSNQNTKVVASKVKNYQKPTQSKSPKKYLDSPKKVKFVLTNNSMQGATDYYRSVMESPSIPYDGSRLPSKTNLKPTPPTPVRPFRKMKLKKK